MPYYFSTPQWFICYYCGNPYLNYITWVPVGPVAPVIVPSLPSPLSYPTYSRRQKNDVRLDSNLSRTGTMSITAVGEYEGGWCKPLSNLDAEAFKQFLLNKGWKINIEHYNENVTPEDFVMAGETCDIMFHTGHGSDDGQLPLYPRDKYLKWSDLGRVSKSKIVIMLTCSVLNIQDWGRLLGNGAHHILGYKQPSNDRKDHFIISEFLARCFGEGIAPSTILTAWENVNNTYDETSSWTVLSHRGNIDDYMIGVESGLTKDIQGLDDIVRLTSSGVKQITIPDEFHSGRFFYEVKVRHQKIDIDRIIQNLLKGRGILTRNNFFNAKVYTDGQSNVFIYPTEAMIYEGTRARTIFNGTEESAIHTAEEFIITKGGGLPPDARVAEVKEQYQFDATETNKNVISYTIIYKNHVGKVPVDGNYGDSIKVIVDNNGVSYMFRLWREVTSKEKITGSTPVGYQDAVRRAEEYFINNMKTASPPKFEEIQKVYWSASFKEFQDKLPVAWKVTLSGKDIFVDTKTGRILS
jgi:hypothetical protein